MQADFIQAAGKRKEQLAVGGEQLAEKTKSKTERTINKLLLPTAHRLLPTILHFFNDGARSAHRVWSIEHCTPDD